MQVYHIHIPNYVTIYSFNLFKVIFGIGLNKVEL